jgi:hypothetical protein
VLDNHMVLVAGGFDPDAGTLVSAELYDPTTRTWRAIDGMSTARLGHTATLLDGGRVLIAGGQAGPGQESLAAAELYDPKTATWGPTWNLAEARDGHTATLLADGEVLVAGGFRPDRSLDSAELYAPGSGT